MVFCLAIKKKLGSEALQLSLLLWTTIIESFGYFKDVLLNRIENECIYCDTIKS